MPTARVLVVDDAEEVTDLLDAVLTAARGETDPAKRNALYVKFQRIVVEDCCDIFGVLEKRKLAMRNTVKGYSFTPVASNAPELFPLSL